MAASPRPADAAPTGHAPAVAPDAPPGAVHAVRRGCRRPARGGARTGGAAADQRRLPRMPRGPSLTDEAGGAGRLAVRSTRRCSQIGPPPRSSASTATRVSIPRACPTASRSPPVACASCHDDAGRQARLSSAPGAGPGAGGRGHGLRGVPRHPRGRPGQVRRRPPLPACARPRPAASATRRERAQFAVSAHGRASPPGRPRRPDCLDCHRHPVARTADRRGHDRAQARPDRPVRIVPPQTSPRSATRPCSGPVRLLVRTERARRGAAPGHRGRRELRRLPRQPRDEPGQRRRFAREQGPPGRRPARPCHRAQAAEYDVQHPRGRPAQRQPRLAGLHRLPRRACDPRAHRSRIAGVRAQRRPGGVRLVPRLAPPDPEVRPGERLVPDVRGQLSRPRRPRRRGDGGELRELPQRPRDQGAVDPTSSVNKAQPRRHLRPVPPGANRRFTIGRVHTSPEQRDASPILYWIANLYVAADRPRDRRDDLAQPVRLRRGSSLRKLARQRASCRPNRLPTGSTCA